MGADQTNYRKCVDEALALLGGKKRSMESGLTKAKMAEVRWVKPVLVGQFEVLEWAGDNHLRHAKFVRLREDKTAKDVVRE